MIAIVDYGVGNLFSLKSSLAAIPADYQQYRYCGDWLFSQVHVEDAAGTWVLDSGWSYDCAREGYELVAAGSSVSTPEDFKAATVRLSGQGALAIYRKL